MCIYTWGIPKRPSNLAMLIDCVEAESPIIAGTVATVCSEQVPVSLKTGSMPFAS